MSLPLSAGGGVYCSTMVRNLSLVSRRARYQYPDHVYHPHGDAVKLVFERFFRDDGADRGFHGLYGGGAFVFVDHGHFAEHCLGPKGDSLMLRLWLDSTVVLKTRTRPESMIYIPSHSLFSVKIISPVLNFRIIFDNTALRFPSPYNGKCPKQAHHQYIIVARRIA